VVAVILGNPVMIDAYRAGIPGNGKPVPDPNPAFGRAGIHLNQFSQFARGSRQP